MTAVTPEMLADLFDRHAAGMVLYVRGWSDSAEDIVQEAFIKLACQKSLPQQPAAWLFRTAKNAALSAARASKRRKIREASTAKPEAWLHATHDSLDAKQAAESLETLPDDVREVVVGRIWGALTFEEISELAGSSLSAVYRKYHDGLAMMQKEMGAKWNQPKT